MFIIGQRVRHSGHGAGEVIEVRSGAPHSEGYMESARFSSAFAEEPALGCLAVAMTAYSPERYPYRVRFESGFEEVYGETELEAIN